MENRSWFNLANFIPGAAAVHRTSLIHTYVRPRQMCNLIHLFLEFLKQITTYVFPIFIYSLVCPCLWFVSEKRRFLVSILTLFSMKELLRKDHETHFN